MTFITFLQTFGDSIHSFLLYILPFTLSFKNYILIVAIISSLWLVTQLSRYNLKRFKSFTINFILCVIVTLLFPITPILYGYNSETFKSYYLVFIAEIFVNAICAPFVSVNLPGQERIKRACPFLAVLFTFVAIQGILTAGTGSGGGTFSSDFAGSYQGISYLLSYASGLAEYYLVAYEDVNWGRLFNRRFARIGMIIVVFTNFYFILVAGGRGALVTFAVITAISLLLWQIRSDKNVSQRIITLIGVVSIIFIALRVVRLASQNTFQGSGFGRILATIESGDSSGRDRIYNLGLQSFLKSPIIGHGFGSVFYEFGFHYHNMFVDVAVELGIVGIIIWIYMLLKSIRRFIALIKLDYSHYLWLVVFLCGFVQGLFSGYYLSHREMIWAMAFVCAFPLNTIKQEDIDR